MVSNVASMSRHELLLCIQDRKDEIIKKIKNGETEESFPIGGASFTNSEWEKLLKKVDKNIEEIKEQQEEEKQERMEALYEADAARRSCLVEKLNGTYRGTVPYGYLAQNGVILYNGVEFVCDERSNSICLGDMSDPKEVLTIRLSGGGRLMVNRKNLGELSQAITMFSPEDINLIMRAIADDKKAQEALREIEEDVNGVGDDAEENVLNQDQLAQLVCSRE